MYKRLCNKTGLDESVSDLCMSKIRLGKFKTVYSIKPFVAQMYTISVIRMFISLRVDLLKNAPFHVTSILSDCIN